MEFGRIRDSLDLRSIVFSGNGGFRRLCKEQRMFE